MKIKSVFLSSLLIFSALFGQQNPTKPFALTHYEKRIPADAWMLFSVDAGEFFNSKEFLKASFENSTTEDAPPKAIADLFTSGKINMIFPYPMVFGVGGDPDKLGNSPDNNPALMSFLKQRHQFGLYFNLSQVPEDVITTFYREEAANGNVKFTEAQALELFRSLKKIIPPAHFGMNFRKGEFNIVGAVHDKKMANIWPGNGLPKTLLDAIPNSSLMVKGASLNLEEANDDIQVRLAQILNIANSIQKITAPAENPPLDLEQMGAQLNDLTREAVGLDAKDLLKIFQGDLVMAVGMDAPADPNAGAPVPNVVIGAIVKDERKLTDLLNALRDKEILPNVAAKIVRKPGHLFFCSPILAPQLEKGALARPLAGPARKMLQNNHLTMYFDMKKVMNLQAQAGQNWFGQGDEEMTNLFNQLDSMLIAGRFEEGKMMSRFAFKFRDAKMDTLALFAKMGAMQQEAAKTEPAQPVDQMALLEFQAQQGDAKAMYQLGSAYWEGKGVDKNQAKGAEWFSKAAKADHPGGQYMMGVIHWHGQWAKKDMVTSYYWLSIAAARGHAEAAKWKPKAGELITADQRAIVEKAVADRKKN